MYTKQYPPGRFKRDCLAEYARYQYQGDRLFRTVGFDASFYGPPSERQLAHYASLLPDDFQMCSKVWEDLTVPAYAKHSRYGTRANPHFLDAQYFMDQVLGRYENVFRRFTGPFLFEFRRARVLCEASYTLTAILLPTSMSTIACTVRGAEPSVRLFTRA